MKCNQWTLALAALGLVSLASVAQADDKPNALLTSVASTTLSGYVDTSMQWNPGTGNANAPAYSFGGPGKADGFNLNTVDVNLEKDADAADSWGAGYRVELWMGPDANALATQSSGVGTGTDFAVKNAYVDLKAPLGNGLDAKIGVWDTPIGYEVADSPNNPNFTRYYGFTMEPTTHTGVLRGYTVSDMLTLSAGIADSFGPTINGRSMSAAGTVRESYKTYMGAVTFTASTNWGWVGGSTITGCIINGYNPGGNTPTTVTLVGGVPNVTAGPLGRDQTSFYAGSTLNTPLNKLKVGASFDYVDIRAQPLNGFQQSYQWNAAFYATFQLTEKMSLNGRAEYFQQSKNISGTSSFNGALPSKAIECTATLQYDLWKNVLSRVEFRWDHQAGSITAGASGVPAFGGAGTTSAVLSNGSIGTLQ